jgi:hypothetical protein
MIPLALAFFVLAQLTAADWAGWVSLVTIVAKVIADWINRRQDRLDKESAAAIVLSELKAQELRVKLAAAEREERIVAKIDENTEVSKSALDKANGTNEKIKNAMETVVEVAKAIESQGKPKEE